MFKISYDAGARFTGSGGGCGGCGGQPFPRNPPCGSRPALPKVQRYCDGVAGASEVNPELIGEIIRDLHCVFEKTYGRKARAEAHYRNLATELEEVKDDLACSECCKEELENELIKLHPELKALQFTLEEEIQRRTCLESIIAQLRAQLARADAMLDADCRDKMAMQGRIKELEAQICRFQDALECLQSEKEDLTRTCRQFDEYKMRQEDSNVACSQHRLQLEQALAKCCKANEELQKELISMAKERDCLVDGLETCENQKRQMAEEFECQRRQWSEERDRMEQMISDLRKAVECLTAQNQEICDKMREVVNAHHREMDTLRKEADKYRRLYEAEQLERQRAEEAHKKCQEELRRKVLECQQKAFETKNNDNDNNNGDGAFSPRAPTNPCAEILARINGAYPRGCSGGSYSAGNNSSSTPPNDVSKLQRQLHESEKKRMEQDQKVQTLQSQVQSLQLKLQVRGVPTDRDHAQERTVLDIEEEVLQLRQDLEWERNQREEVELELANVKAELAADTHESSDEAGIKLDNTSNSDHLEALRLEDFQRKLRVSEDVRLDNEEKISELEVRIHELEQKLVNAAAERKHLEDRVEEAARQTETLREVLHSERESREWIQTSLEQKERILNEELKEKGVLQQRIHQLQERVDHLDNNNNVLEESKAALNELRLKLNQLESEKVESDLLIKQLETAHAEKIQADENVLKKSQEDALSKIQKLEEHLQFAESHQAELTALRCQLEEASKQRLELDQLKISLELANQQRAELEILREKSQLALEERIELENKCSRLKRSAEDLQVELERVSAQLRATEAKDESLAELRRQLGTADAEIQVLRQKVALFENQSRDTEVLRQELRAVHQQKITIEQHLAEFKLKMVGMEPRLDELSEQGRQTEERLSAVMEENLKLKKVAEEARMAHDLVQRELRDLHSMWETEVKAKGILAEKIAKYERMSAQADSRAKQDSDFLERIKEKARQLKVELKAEREQSNKLKQKVDLLKEQLRTARDQLQELAHDPRVHRLADQLDRQKMEHARTLQKIAVEREALMAEFYRLGQEKLALEKELNGLKDQIQKDTAKDKGMIDKLMATKERLEAEMLSIRTLVNKRYVEKSVLDTMRKDHESNMMALKSQLESQAEQELGNKLSQIGALLDNQNRDRVLIEKIRNANDSSIRTEFTAMVKNMKGDMERLQGLLKAREEEITTLRSCVTHFKEKVAAETKEKNELIRKLKR